MNSITNIRDIVREIEQQLIDDEPFVDIWVRQRNGRKCITVVEGLDAVELNGARVNMQTVATHLRKVLRCGNCVKTGQRDDGSYHTYIQMQGDHRDAVHDFLVGEKLTDATHIRKHGWD